MAASVAPLETAPHDCSGADDHAARLRTLRTFGGYAIYPVFVVFWLLRWICTSVFAVVVFVFRGGRSARHEERHYGHLSATSGSSDAMAASSGEPDANQLIRQKQHHKRAFDFISKALKYDEENDDLKELAIDLYRKGIRGTTERNRHRLLSRKRSFLGTSTQAYRQDEAHLWEASCFTCVIVRMISGGHAIEHLGDDLPWHAGVARPQANQKRRAWQKAAPGHDAAAKLDGPSWLKMAENGGPGSQVNDRHRRCLSPPLSPRSGCYAEEPGRNNITARSDDAGSRPTGPDTASEHDGRRWSDNGQIPVASFPASRQRSWTNANGSKAAAQPATTKRAATQGSAATCCSSAAWL
ncbi:hypothetical protein MRX96_042889 [Rhipicephalus microplus]